jgi:hypothetical protein
MIKQIAAGYGKSLALLAKVLVLLALCFAMGFILVYPLWTFAVSDPVLYSACVLALMAIIAAAALGRKVKSALRGAKTRAEKRRALGDLCVAGGKILFPVMGAGGFVYFVVQDKKALAFLALVMALGIHGVLAYGKRKTGGA